VAFETLASSNLNAPRHGGPDGEADHSLHQAQARASMGAAVVVLARQWAIKAAKREFQAQGRKPQYMAHGTIVAAAKEYQSKHRAELIAEAREIVERRHA
jgi:hypothetical protein